MFKRTLLAVGIIGMSSGASAVSVITAATTGLALTPQAVGAAGVVVEAKDFVIAVTDVIALNGKSLQITFSKAPVAALLPTTLVVTDSASACGNAVMADLAYAGVTNDGKTVNYSISGNDASPATCLITVPDIHFPKASLTSSGITAVSSFTIVGSGVSTSAGKQIIDLTASQYSLTVGTLANEKINVNTNRKTYVGGVTDTLAFTLADLDTVTLNDGVAFGSHEISITGDFSWADNPLTAAFDPTTARQGQTPISIDGGATLDTVKSTTSKLVFDDTNNDGTYIVTFRPLIDANLTDALPANDVVAVAIPVQTFTVSTTATYADEAKAATGVNTSAAGTQVVAAKAAGSWALNGATTKIFAVPFGAEVTAHNIFVSNKGTSTGAITGSMAWNGNTAVAFALGNVEPGANKYLNIMDALTALGEKPAFGRADVTLTVNSPLSDITFTAGYTTASGRANLVMTQQSNIDAISNTASTNAVAAHAAVDVACANLVTTEDNLDNIAGSSVAITTSVASYTNTGTAAGAAALTACP